ncbi:MAG TPA: hypothetical protein VK796_03450 [Cytophaga sp.]|nr:hypothetical protein [Cytophaga sp.]
MKQLLLFLAFSFLLAGCSDKDGSSDSNDSTSTSPSVDTSINTTSTKADDYESMDYYEYSEFINKPGTITLVTIEDEICSDILLQNPLQTLTVGQHIFVEKYCGTTTKNSWTEPVYEITYYDSSKKKIRGYISQSNIACRLDTLQSKKIVALTIDYNTLKERFIAKVSLLDQSRKTLATTSVELDIPKEDNAPHSFTYYFNFEESDKNTGLDGITECFYITAHYDACSYPQISNIFLWNEKKLIVAPESYSVADADVFFAASYLIFPSDSLGRQSYVLNIIEVQEDIDSPPHTIDKTYSKKDSTVIAFKWNKATATFSKGDTIVKTSRTFVLPNLE